MRWTTALPNQPQQRFLPKIWESANITRSETWRSIEDAKTNTEFPLLSQETQTATLVETKLSRNGQLPQGWLTLIGAIIMRHLVTNTLTTQGSQGEQMKITKDSSRGILLIGERGEIVLRLMLQGTVVPPATGPSTLNPPELLPRCLKEKRGFYRLFRKEQRTLVALWNAGLR